MNKVRIAVISIVSLLVATVLYAASPTLSTDGYQVNSKGTTGSPVAVGTNTPIVIIAAAQRRCSWTFSWTGAGNLVCQPIPYGAASPTDTPTAAPHGMILKSGSPWSSNILTDDPTLGWSCVSDSGTLAIATYEVRDCKKGPQS